MTGVYDPVPLKGVFPSVQALLGTVPYLKANHLSVFSSGDLSELGKPLESVFSTAVSGDCTGAAESIAIIDDPAGHGLRVLGWAWDLKHGQPPAGIVVTTDGVITGFGAVGEERRDLPASHPEVFVELFGICRLSSGAAARLGGELLCHPRRQAANGVLFRDQEGVGSPRAVFRKALRQPVSRLTLTRVNSPPVENSDSAGLGSVAGSRTNLVDETT